MDLANPIVVSKPISETEPLWTVEEVAEYLRLQPETVRMMAREGKLPAFKVGRVWRFRIGMLKEHLSESVIHEKVEPDT